MDMDKRVQKLEAEMQKVTAFLPNVELWMNVLATQFQLNRNFILSLDKKPEPKAETPLEVVEPVKTETTDVPLSA